MTKEITQVIIQFMNRVQLTGAEVPAWAAAMTALNDIISGSTNDSNNPK